MERSFIVDIGARTQAYEAAMKAAEGATGHLIGKLADLDDRVEAFGRRMTIGVSVPLAASGAAAVKLASSFDASFAKMVSLAGVATSEVGGLKEQVLALSGTTAQSPQELADALYFLRSSGLDASAAMDALEVSAKASAAGLGDTATIADAVSSAMNAYGSDVLSAAEASDVLLATVREGKGEPEELAAAIGRVIAPAEALGVEFYEVGAALASMTQVGLDADEATTSLRGTLMALQNPTKEQADALEEMGFSLQQVRDVVANEGLLAGLTMLAQGAEGNVEAMSALFGNVRALNGVLIMTGENAPKTAETLDRLAGSAGSTDRAFDSMADTAGFKMSQAWADLQTAMIQVGDVLLPIGASIAGGVSDIVGVFNDLPGPIQTAIVALGGFIALIGPAIFIAPTVAMFLLAGALKQVATNALLASGAMGTLGATSNTVTTTGFMSIIARLVSVRAGLIETGAIAAIFGEQMLNYQERTKSTMSGWEATGAGIRAVFTGDVFTPGYWKGLDASIAPTLAHARDVVEGLTVAQSGLVYKIQEITAAAGEQVVAYDEQQAAAVKVAESVDRAAQAHEGFQRAVAHGEAERESAEAADVAAAAHEALQQAYLDAAAAADKARQAAHDLRIENLQAAGGVLDLESNQLRLADAMATIKDREKDAADAVGEFGDHSDEATAATNDLRQAQIDAAEQAFATATAFANQSGAVEGSRKHTNLMRTALTMLAAENPGIRGEIQAMIDKLNEIPPKKHTDVGLDGRDKAVGDAGDVRKGVDDIPKSHDTEISVTDHATAVLVAIQNIIAGIHDKTVTVTTNFTPGMGDHASGGRIPPGEMVSLVGEQGPELVSLPVGSYVYPHGESMRMMDELGIKRYATGGRVERGPAVHVRESPAVRSLYARAEELRALADATKDASEAADLRRKAEDLAARASKLHGQAVEREADEIDRYTDKLERNADALRDDARAVIEASRDRADALDAQANSVRDVVDAELALHAAQRAAGDATAKASRAMQVEGVTARQRAEALDEARLAVLRLADAEVAQARARAAARGQRFTDADAAQVTRQSLIRQAGRDNLDPAVAANLRALIRDMNFARQRQLREDARDERRRGAREAGSIRQDARDLDKQRHALDKVSTGLHRLSDTLENVRVNAGDQLIFHIHGNAVATPEFRRIIQQTINDSARRARAGTR